MRNEESSSVLSIPNLLTFLRLALTPPFIYFMLKENWEYAMYLGAVSVATDFLDGYIARKFNMITEFGKKFDPTVDKIILISTFYVFLIKDILPKWFVIGVLMKDIFIPLILLTGKIMGVKLNFTPTKVGKITVAGQFTVIVFVIVEKNLGIRTFFELLMVPILALSIASVFSYVILIYKLIKGAKTEEDVKI